MMLEVDEVMIAAFRMEAGPYSYHFSLNFFLILFFILQDVSKH